MATNLLPIHAIGVRASAVFGHRETSTNTGNCDASWWSPLFGWSSTVDYIDSSSKKQDQNPNNLELRSENNPDLNLKPAKPRFVPGCFTEEKAKQLRMKMAMESASFHDVMYHSAIASRLASDFSRKQ